jgi:hypothetical protein
VGNLLFILVQYLAAKAAGIPAIFIRTKEMALPEIEQNFFNSNYYAKRSINLLRKAIETFFGSKNSTIFLRASAFLFFAALACLVTLLFIYVGAWQLFTFVESGFSIKLQPDEFDKFRNFAGSAFDWALTPDHFFHASYFVAVTAALFIFAYAVLSACSAVVCVGLYRFVVWFSQTEPLTSSQIFFRLFRLLALILLADVMFLLISFGTPMFLGHVVNIQAFQQSNVQKIEWTNGPQDMLVYRVGILLRQVDNLSPKPFIQYSFGLGVGPISPSDIPTQGTPRPILEQLFGSGLVFSSTDAFCVDAGVTNRLECGRRLTDKIFVRLRHSPDDFWFGLARHVFEKVGNAVCFETDFVPADFPPTVRFAFTLYMPFLVTIVLEWLLGALIVPILSFLYLLDRLVVRIGRWQIVRSELGLSLMTKHASSLLALPVIVLLALLRVARKAYCGG